MNSFSPPPSIGVFDSGLGGLTVVRQLQQVFPHLSIIYYGDTARVPYGTKSADTVIRFSRQIVDFLLTREIQAIVVACNTASATAVPVLRTEYDIPIYGVIEPGAAAAVASTRNGRIGVIGTHSTITASVYTKAIRRLNDDIRVYGRACPLFVPLVEEGWEDHTVTRMIAGEYLEEILVQDIDTLILGCTHYPLLARTLRQVVSEDITIIDSGVAAANALRDRISSDHKNVAEYTYYVSDTPARFSELGARFLGHPMEEVYHFDVEGGWESEDIHATPLIAK